MRPAVLVLRRFKTLQLTTDVDKDAGDLRSDGGLSEVIAGRAWLACQPMRDTATFLASYNSGPTRSGTARMQDDFAFFRI